MTIFQAILKGAKLKKLVQACSKGVDVNVIYQWRKGGALFIQVEGYLENMYHFQRRLVNAEKENKCQIVDLAALDRD